MSMTTDGDRIVVAETALPASNPRGITGEWLVWNVEKNIPVYGQTANAVPKNSLMLIGALALAGLGIVLILKRKRG